MKDFLEAINENVNTTLKIKNIEFIIGNGVSLVTSNFILIFMPKTSKMADEVEKERQFYKDEIQKKLEKTTKFKWILNKDFQGISFETNMFQNLLKLLP